MGSCTQNLVIHALIGPHRNIRIDPGARTHITDRKLFYHQHTDCFLSHHQILFLVLLISISRNSGQGTYLNAHFELHPDHLVDLAHATDREGDTVLFNLTQRLHPCPLPHHAFHLQLPTLPQRLSPKTERSSNALLTNASNRPKKFIALMVCTDQSGK